MIHSETGGGRTVELHVGVYRSWCVCTVKLPGGVAVTIEKGGSEKVCRTWCGGEGRERGAAGKAQQGVGWC